MPTRLARPVEPRNPTELRSPDAGATGEALFPASNHAPRGDELRTQTPTPASGVGLDFRRFEHDRRELRAQIDAFRGRPGSRAGGLRPAERLVGILATYEEVARRLATGGSPRDTAQLIAWTRQAGSAVTPVYHGSPFPTLVPFGQFVEASVVAVILLEDAGETFKGPELDVLDRDVTRVASHWIDERRVGCALPRPRCHAQGVAARAYLGALRDALALLEDLVAALCPRAMQGGKPRRQLQAFLAQALREVLDALEFSRRFDRLARGVGASFPFRIGGCMRRVTIRELDLADFLAANQANIFMRFMLTVNALHYVDTLAPGHDGAHIDPLIRAIAPLGCAVERLGNMSNDLATLFREIGEGFVSNFVLAEGLARGVFSPCLLQETFSELERHLPMPARKTLLEELARAFFETRSRAALGALAREYPALRTTHRFLEKMHESGLVEGAIARWRRELASARRAFGDGHPLDRLFDLDDLWDRQVRFLFQYLTANGLV